MDSLLTNMQMSAKEAKEESQPAVADAPRYPWGLCISLNCDSLKKLGIDKLPAVGTEVTIVAKAEVSATRDYQTQGGESEASMDVQITDMKLDGASDATTKLYPSMKKK